MKIRNILLVGGLATALIAAPAFAATLRGKVVAIGTDTITVMADGKTTTYVLPQDIQVQSPQQQQVDLGALQAGQMVVLTVAEPTQVQGQTGQVQQMPAATSIKVEEDIEIEREIEDDD